jgi:hypothetical protein
VATKAVLLGKFKCGHLWAREFTSAPRFTSYIRGKKIWYSLANFRLFRISPSIYSAMLLFYSCGIFEDSKNYKIAQFLNFWKYKRYKHVALRRQAEIS